MYVKNLNFTHQPAYFTNS